MELSKTIWNSTPPLRQILIVLTTFLPIIKRIPHVQTMNPGYTFVAIISHSSPLKLFRLKLSLQWIMNWRDIFHINHALLVKVVCYCLIICLLFVFIFFLLFMSNGWKFENVVMIIEIFSVKLIFILIWSWTSMIH